MDFDQEDELLNKYRNKYVIISTNEEKIYGKIGSIGRACNSDSGNTEIRVTPVGETYFISVEDAKIVSIEIVSKEDCIGKDEEPLN